MFTAWFYRSTRRRDVRKGLRGGKSPNRRVPHVELCEDRALPGQLFHFSPELLAGPLVASLGIVDPDPARLPAAPRPAGPTSDSPAPAAVAPENLAYLAGGLGQAGLSNAEEAGTIAVNIVQPDTGTAPIDLITQAVAVAGADTVTLTGTLETLDALDPSGLDQSTYYLNTGGTRLPLITDATADYPSGTVITARGRLSPAGLVVAPNGMTVQPTADGQAASPDGVAASGQLDPQGDGQDGDGTPPPPPSASGFHSVLVINVNFSDLHSQPWTTSSVNTLFNNSVSRWFSEGSYGKMTEAADVAGWYTIAANSQTCNTSTWATQAQAAAKSHGFVLNNYTHVIIAFPHVAACGWAGLGQVPGRLVWLNGAMSLGVVVHEMGHNLGLAHSHAQRCSTGPLTGTCTTTEYGDDYDTMGSGGQAHYHASYAASLGWIPSSDRITLTSAVGQRDVALSPEESSSGKRLLRVQRKGRSDYLNVEVRQAVGFDSVLSRYSALTNGVAVYLGSGLNGQSIIDFGYRTSSSGDAAVPIGKTLTDSVGHVTITPYQKSGGLTYVHVQYT